MLIEDRGQCCEVTSLLPLYQGSGLEIRESGLLATSFDLLSQLAGRPQFFFISLRLSCRQCHSVAQVDFKWIFLPTHPE